MAEARALPPEYAPRVQCEKDYKHKYKEHHDRLDSYTLGPAGAGPGEPPTKPAKNYKDKYKEEDDRLADDILGLAGTRPGEPHTKPAMNHKDKYKEPETRLDGYIPVCQVTEPDGPPGQRMRGRLKRPRGRRFCGRPRQHREQLLHARRRRGRLRGGKQLAWPTAAEAQQANIYAPPKHGLDTDKGVQNPPGHPGRPPETGEAGFD